MSTTSFESNDITPTPAFAQLAKPNPSLSRDNTTLHALGHGPCYRCGSCTYPFYSSTAFELPSNNREWCSICSLQDRNYVDEMEQQGAMNGMSADEVMEYQLKVNYDGEVPTKRQLEIMKKEVGFKPFYNESQRSVQNVQQVGSALPKNQTFHPGEVITLDDDSDDDTTNAQSQQRVEHVGYQPNYHLSAPPKGPAQQAAGEKTKKERKILPARAPQRKAKPAPPTSQAPVPQPAPVPQIANGNIATDPSHAPAKRQRKPTQKALPSLRNTATSSTNASYNPVLQQKPLPPPPLRPGGPCHICKVVKSTSWRRSTVCSKTPEGGSDGQRVSVMWCENCGKNRGKDGVDKEGASPRSAHDPPKRKEGSSPAKRTEGLREMGEY